MLLSNLLSSCSIYPVTVRIRDTYKSQRERILHNRSVSSFPSTILATVSLVASHMNWIEKPWQTRHFWSSGSSLVCVNARQILERGHLIRLMSAPMEHSSDVHLAICLFSLIVKGYQIERAKGSLYFLVRLLISMACTSLAYCIMSWAFYHLSGNQQYMTECVQGLSGALFALKLLCLRNTQTFTSPIALYEIFELLILKERRTFLLHLSGLTVGFLVIILESGKRFPGSGIPLGGGNRSSKQADGHIRRWTRSWGYANCNQFFHRSKRRPLTHHDHPVAPGEDSNTHVILKVFRNTRKYLFDSFLRCLR